MELFSSDVSSLQVYLPMCCGPALGTLKIVNWPSLCCSFRGRNERSSRTQRTELSLWQRKLKSPFSGTVRFGPSGVMVSLDLTERNYTHGSHRWSGSFSKRSEIIIYCFKQVLCCSPISISNHQLIQHCYYVISGPCNIGLTCDMSYGFLWQTTLCYNRRVLKANGGLHW